jgi:hypothetical protein
LPYTETTWVDNTAPAISAANLQKIERGIHYSNQVFNVLDAAYGATGNGSTDDTTALQAAITAAAAVGGVVYSPPGYTYIITAKLTFTSTVHLVFNNSTIKAKSTMLGLAMGEISGSGASGTTFDDVVFHGNRAAGAQVSGPNVISSATGVVWRNVQVLHCYYGGPSINTGAAVDAYDSTFTDNVGTGSCDGIGAYSSALLRTYNCTANSNDRNGFYFDAGAADGCRLEGSAYQNNYSGAAIHSNYGTCPRFVCEQSSQFGLTVGGSGHTTTGWTFDYVETNNTGVAIPGYAQNNAGTGIELYGAAYCNFGTVISKKNLGYGMVLATNGTTGSKFNTIHGITCDQTGAADRDPGISITGTSTNNQIGNCSIRGHTVGIVIGESTSGNDHNVFGIVYLANNTHGGITIDGGNKNSFQNVVSRNTYTSDLTITSKAVVTFATANATLNVIGFLDHDDTGTDHTTVPAFLAYADASAVNNLILDGFARASRSAAVDLNGGNAMYLRRASRRTSISTFDSGETWSSSANNTTNGQFVEGNGAKKVTGAPGFTTSSRTSLTLNFSTMAASDWFRMYAYVTNQSDLAGAAGAVELRFRTSVGNYYAVSWNGAGLVNGAQWLSARKGAFAATGAPNWASITAIDLLVFGSASTATVTFDDLIIAETKWDRTSTIGQNNTPASITVAASPFLYQNTDGVPLNVMVSGGTVSAIDYSQDGTTFYSQGQIAGVFVVNPGDYTRVTYSVAPTMSKVPTR